MKVTRIVRAGGIAVLFAAAAVLTVGCVSSDTNGGRSGNLVIAYPDASLPDETRAEQLLAEMNLAEKVGQMVQVERAYIRRPEDISRYNIGSILSGGGSSPAPNTPEAWADMIDGFQQQALQTRLRIPLLYGTDAVHGHNNLEGAVIFPHNIGLGATRNPELVQKVAAVTAKEASATGIHWNFAPAVSVPQDIRWGRSYEGFSENPQLVSELGAAAIRGYQSGEGSLAGEDYSFGEGSRLLATAKHFLGDGGTIGGVDQGDVVIGESVLREVHLYPYRAAIEAGVKTVMATFNSIHGEKVHGSRYYLTEVLRDELGFTGLLVSDWGAVKQLPGSRSEQIEAAVLAGIDMVMIPDDYWVFIPTLIELVESGRVPMQRIDEAVTRILTAKFELGLFEQPMTNRENIPSIGSDAHRAVARQAVRESLVVLKDNDVLPLDTGYQHIHVLGNKADDIGVQSGGWTIEWQGRPGPITPGTTILEAIEQAAGEGIQVSHGNTIPDSADVIVLVVGERPYAEYEGDTDMPRISGSDVNLIRAAAAAEVPVLTVLVSGRPLIITDYLDDWDALIAAWLPGTEGGGVADILFGRYPGSGRLSFTWPVSTELYEARNRGEDDPADEVLFEYGFGL